MMEEVKDKTVRRCHRCGYCFIDTGEMRYCIDCCFECQKKDEKRGTDLSQHYMDTDLG